MIFSLCRFAGRLPDLRLYSYYSAPPQGSQGGAQSFFRGAPPRRRTATCRRSDHRGRPQVAVQSGAGAREEPIMESEVPVDGSAAAQPRPAGLDKPAESVVRCTGTVRSGAPCHRVALPGTMPARCEFHRGQRAPVPPTPTPLSQVLRAGGGAGAGMGGNPLAATPAPPKRAEPEPEPCPARDQARASKSASPPPPPPAPPPPPDWLLPDDPARADAERYLIGALNAMAVGALDARAVTVALQVLGRLLSAGEAAGPGADQ